MARSCQNVFDYTARWSKVINKRLAKAKDVGLFREYPTVRFWHGYTGDTIVAMYLDGFYESIPKRLAVHFFHENQTLGMPEVVAEVLRVGTPLLYGPEPIPAILSSDDPRLSMYHIKRTAPSMTDGIELCKRFIAACGSSEARNISLNCLSVGGHTHIATVNPFTGFQWETPPLLE
jgi:hypothetical protein